MKHLGILACAAVIAFSGIAAADVQLNAAVAPNARSVEVGSPATFFATVLNSGDIEATNCRVEPDPDNALGTDMDYRRTDAANQVIGETNTPFSIPAGGSQTLVLTVRPTPTSSGSPYLFNYVCDQGQFETIPNVGSVYIRSVPEGRNASDMIMILQTLSSDGVIRIAENGRRGVAAGAMINNGGLAAFMTINPNFPGFSVQPAGPDANFFDALTICLTDSAGVCQAEPADDLELVNVGPGQVYTFNVYFEDSASGEVPFMPEFLRLMVDAFEYRITGQPGSFGVAGGTSVAVSEPLGPQIDGDSPESGQWYGYYGDSAGFFPRRMRITRTPSGYFVLRTLLGDHVITEEIRPSQILFGEPTLVRDGGALRLSGQVGRISDRGPADTALVDGLTLNVRSRATGRPQALSGEPVRGYFQRDMPPVQLRPFYATESVNTGGPLDNRYDLTGLTADGFTVWGFADLGADQESFSGGVFSFTTPAGTDTCDFSASLVAHESGPGGPAAQSFDATVSISECNGNSGTDFTGEYEGWGIVEEWIDWNGTGDDFRLCSVLVFTERADGQTLPLWIRNAITQQHINLPCPGNY